MKALKVLGIVLASIFVIAIILHFMAPKEFKVERSIVIESKNKEIIFKNVTHWSDFLKWNPWSSKDPNQKLTYKGEEGTVGANYMWEGNDSVGSGEMTITSLTPNEKVEMDLHFIKPFEANNKTIFTMIPEGEGYKVTWIMSGKNDFPFTIISMFMDMDKMVGPDFEKGLKTLSKKVLEESASPAAPSEPAAQPSDSTKVRA